MGKSTSSKSTPPTSRKDVRGPAPYRRSRSADAEAAPPGAAPPEAVEGPAASPPRPPGTPLARVKLVTAPAPVGPSPTPARVLAAAAAAPGLTSVPDFLASLHTSLAFADTALAALAALPHPDELVTAGDPATPAAAPGPAPAGDARSLRAGDQFALVYRHGAAVISRRGSLGQRGAWRVVDYPSAALAAHAYALECSRLVEQGFRDVA